MKKIIALVLVLLCLSSISFAQKRNPLSKEEIANYESQIGQMVNYLQETLNFIGDSTATAKEKETVFTESYLKIFSNDKVQIEDDLDEQRQTPINKDVQAYLKDIDFFFKDAVFAFNIQNVANAIKDDGSVFFKVTMTRSLTGTTITGVPVNNVRNRFVEINLDRQNNDLKIASIYTTKLNEKEELCNWWNSLTYNWKELFGKDIAIADGVMLSQVSMVNPTDYIVTLPILNPLDSTVMKWEETTTKSNIDALFLQLKAITQKQSLDVSNNPSIFSIEPLSELTELNTLNISNTKVRDISPLRNANKLTKLIANHTEINDLSALKYDIVLKELDVANTFVYDLSILNALVNLERLDFSNTLVGHFEDLSPFTALTHVSASGCRVADLTPISNFERLLYLDISHTAVVDLMPISNLKTLQSLNISSTLVRNLLALSEMENLKEVSFSNTRISDLTPLQPHQRLSKIYCDNSGVTVVEASAFTKENPSTLVIYDTQALKTWWDELPIYWKSIFAQQVKLNTEPNTEELHHIINMTTLDLSGNQYLQNLIPVSRLTNLRSLNISHTEITALTPLAGMSNLEDLNVQYTYVSNLTPLENMPSLKTLDISGTPVNDLSPLTNDGNIDLIIADSTSISDRHVTALKSKQPQVTVIYQTPELNKWWSYLDDNWKEIFRKHVPYNGVNPSPIELQKIVDLRDITIDTDIPVQTLEPISKFVWLEILSAGNQGLHDLLPLQNKKYLKELYLPNNPINDLRALASDTAMRVLNVENTQVDDLASLANMQHLRIINTSGTEIRSLKPLSNLQELEELLINNTSVKHLSPIEDIASLKVLKVYNTRVRNKTVQKLQEKRIDLNIVYY
ncbi:MAG: leucine-rich repeat domain-containing protein [Candidatus Limimorpha sp.]